MPTIPGSTGPRPAASLAGPAGGVLPQRKVVSIVVCGQILGGIGMGATLPLGSLLAAQLSGSPAWSGMAATMSTPFKGNPELASALSAAGVRVDTSRFERGAESRRAGASAAWAAIPLVSISPDATAMTVAWRPTPPALPVAVLDIVARVLVLAVTARWRPGFLRADMK